MTPKTRRKKRGRPNGPGACNILAIERLKSGLSQEEVAEATHFSQPYVSKVERGRVPDVLYFYRVAKLFKVPSVGELFERYAKETFDRISPQSIKSAQKKYQPIPPQTQNIEEQQPSPSPLASPDCTLNQRDDVAGTAPTIELAEAWSPESSV